MRTPSHTFRLLGAVLAAGLISGQAMAQVTATADTFAAVLKPLTLTKNSDLNFGVLLAAAGDATINPIDGTRTFSGNAGGSNAPGATIPTRAAFALTGISGATYSISATKATVILTNTVTSADTLTVTLSGVHTLTENKTNPAATASTGTLSAAGSDVLGVGGKLTLASTTVVGNYANPAGIELTVNYN